MYLNLYIPLKKAQKLFLCLVHMYVLKNSTSYT